MKDPVMLPIVTVSYPFGKGKVSDLKTLHADNFQGTFEVLGEEGATHADLMAGLFGIFVWHRQT